MENVYQMILADIPLNVQFASSRVDRDLSRWLLKKGHPLYREDVPAEDFVPLASEEDAAYERELFEEHYAQTGIELTEPALEYETLVYRVSEGLFKHDAFVFHGAAFLWRERAYIFTAPSGTGKTTQYRRWRELYGDEIRILNGDKPVLRFHSAETDSEKAEDTVWVHPSPWHGKEGYGRGAAAPLAGIVYLEQGSENRIRRMTPQEAALPLFSQLLFNGSDAGTIRQGAALISRLAEAVPIWHLMNLGDHASAEMTHEAIFNEDKR